MEAESSLALELTCPVCLLLFSEPACLPCGHIYCFACLQTMGEGLDQHCCPECQAEYQGTKAAVKSVKISNIVETYKATGGSVSASADFSDTRHPTVMNNLSCGTIQSNAKDDKATAGMSQQEGSGSPLEDFKKSGFNEKDGFQLKADASGHSFSLEEEQGSKKEMDEPKFRLASQVTELTLKLEMADSVLRKEKEWKEEVSSANSHLKEKMSKLLADIVDLSQSYSVTVKQLIEEELRPGEEAVSSRVSRASVLTEQLQQAMLKAKSLLTEEDDTVFADELQVLQPRIDKLMAQPLEGEDDGIETKVDPARTCSKLEDVNAELRERIGDVQRSLRNTLNPSEVTFDPDTAHPNLVLSADLKRVTFSSAKQPYPTCPQRFTSFFQVLSAQSFSDGDHRWEVELEVSPWIIGVCYSKQLARSGLPSALESSRSSWCLMWFDNLLTAFERGHSVPLKRTTVSRKLELKLSFKTHRLSFYNISPNSGKTHIYTFKAHLTEPVHLAYRMMAAHPKARATICS
ncbi:E3 ubiquitin-protein ligase TRIM21 [Thalassophryne amazonica]|uniref:E3 ubiquitin-protein ligase TRIM21 n=1 Tax=Thalassophryne amazonica TaxID=390379 RepID=UPI0014714183|nr:E3 ubiquitin-protein ligase TRIM21 [Thalassophryne amazonica]